MLHDETSTQGVRRPLIFRILPGTGSPAVRAGWKILHLHRRIGDGVGRARGPVLWDRGRAPGRTSCSRSPGRARPRPFRRHAPFRTASNRESAALRTIPRCRPGDEKLLVRSRRPRAAPRPRARSASGEGATQVGLEARSSPRCRPSADGPSLVYDPRRDRLILFGGLRSLLYRTRSGRSRSPTAAPRARLTPSGGSPAGRSRHAAI